MQKAIAKTAIVNEIGVETRMDRPMDLTAGEWEQRKPQATDE